MKRTMIVRTPRRKKFDEMVVRANRGDTKPLLNYLIKNERWPLDMRRAIAGMIHNEYQHGKPGSPHGNRTPKFDATRHTAARKACILIENGKLQHDAIEAVMKEYNISDNDHDALAYLVEHPSRIKVTEIVQHNLA